MLKADDETVPGPGAGGVASAIYADDSYWMDARLVPQLTITYYPSTGLPGALESGLAVAGDPNFGGKELYSGFRHYFYGIRSSIRPPSTDFSLHGNTIAVMRVAAENALVGGLVQTGFGQTNNGSAGMDFCGSRTHLTYFYEFAIAQQNYQCSWLDVNSQQQSQIPFQYNTSRAFTAERILGTCSGSSEGGTSTWVVRVDSYDALCLVLWNHAYHIVAGGEINTPQGSGLQRGTLSGCFGCDGGRAWQRGKGVSASGTAWYTIRHARNISTRTLGWSVTSLPAPFTVSNTG